MRDVNLQLPTWAAKRGALQYTFEFDGKDDTGRPVHLQITVQPPLAKYIGDLPKQQRR